MPAIIILMLVLDAAVIIMVAWAIEKDSLGGRPLAWSSLAVTLMICAAASFSIGNGRAGQEGADFLEFASPVLLGMGLMAIFLAIRQRKSAKR